MSKKRNRKQRRPSNNGSDGVAVDAPDAPAEWADAGSSQDLREQYVHAQIRAYRSAAKRHFANAKRLVRQSRPRAEAEARTALDRIVRAFWWAEGTPQEEDQHQLMHQLGRWTRRTFGCWVYFDGAAYQHRCPVVVAHKRMGNSIGFTAQRICSLCGDDLSECPHRRGRAYWVRGGPWANGPCRVCLSETPCRHSADRLYRSGVVSIIKEADLREVSLVRRPAQPEARMTAIPISTEGLRAALGSRFRVGMPVSCDKCLGECDGIEDPFLEREGELLEAVGQVEAGPRPQTSPLGG